MIAALIRWSARNVFLVGFAAIFVTLAGIYAVSRVPRSRSSARFFCAPRTTY